MEIIIKEVQAKSIISSSRLPAADEVINAYTGCTHGCIYCYAEFMKKFTGHAEEWGSFLDIKGFDKKKLLNHLSGIKEYKKILLSSVTDPYLPQEINYKSTRSILEIIDQAGNDNVHPEILTKSSLILRDIPLLKKIRNIKVGISMNTVNEGLRRKIEPYASSVGSRLKTLRELRKNSISTYMFISPIFPGLTEIEDLIALSKDISCSVYFENLNLRGAYKKRVMDFIQKEYPEHAYLYHSIYVEKNEEYWHSLRKKIERDCEASNVEYKIFFFHGK